MSNGIYCIKFSGARRNMAACGGITSPKAMKLEEKSKVGKVANMNCNLFVVMIY